MILTVLIVLVIAAFICTIWSVLQPPVPLWIAVLLLCVIEMVQVLPK